MSRVDDVVVDLLWVIRILLMSKPLLHSLRLPVGGNTQNLFAVTVHKHPILRVERESLVDAGIPLLVRDELSDDPLIGGRDPIHTGRTQEAGHLQCLVENIQ